MKKQSKKYDRCRYEWETGFQQSVAERVHELSENIKNDPDREDRLSKNLCPVCFYRNGEMHMNAFYEKDCDICGFEMKFSTSCTGAVCMYCAGVHEICNRCGADVDLKVRKDKFKEES